MPGEIEVRRCTTVEEYAQCVELERIVWGVAITVPSGMFVVAQHTGGQVLGAFEGGKLVGFTLALMGKRGSEDFLHSHMTAVLEDYRDKGVGRRLKLFQRQDALKRGIRVVEWTFDPLELKNAHFNLVRLGAVARRFIPNCYGTTDSPLHSGLPTDRLVAEWWLDSDRVKNILADNPHPPQDTAARISLPSNLGEIKAADRDVATVIQTRARDQFQKHFAQGRVATAVEKHDALTDYILEPGDAIAGLALPPNHKE
ncbi:MAG TPA: GNAT family N-acetyltransferase [Candidatus Limnocylindrales bacterium]|nr:GNAT family N-acetyltransferase [Candidatus Limnocylindrales bacterium]